MKHTVVITSLLFLALACKKKKTENPAPVNPPSNNTNMVPKKRVTLIDELTVYNVKTSDDVDKPYTLFNFAKEAFVESRADSFDLAFYTWKIKGQNNNDTVFFNLCGPSYSALRLELGNEIEYKTRKTVFYLPNSPQSFYKSIFDTIQYAASLPVMIKERFTKFYNPQTSEEGFVLQKQTPFLTGTFLAFKTHTGRHGIMRVVSDGNTAQDRFVKLEIKYQP